MSMHQKKSKALLWRVALVGGLIVEVVLITVAILAITRENQTIPAWQQIAFVAILVWIYIAYLKQRSMDISAFVVDEKVKVHSLVENLAEGVILLDPDNKILLLNARVVELTGLSEIESLGKDLSEEERGKIEAAIKDAEEAHRGNDVDAIKQKSEALGTAAQKLGEKMYAKQQAEAGAAGASAGAGPEAGASGGGGAKDDGDVVDAEYTEVKDKK